MITKTLNLDDAYQDLFNEVREKSDGDINVSNLEAFFGSIREIAALDSKFLRLPLDEPFFEIDANSRKITVPADFKTNGVSVQGDHLAEVIFFRIARFFDYKDLSTCDILINWKMGTKEGKTTRFIKFDDNMVEPDETKTECIIFGWPINDVVTEKSGALTFAIEFRNVSNSGEVLYRFNTLPVTVNIKDGLILGEDVTAYTLDQDIIDNLVNSAFGEGTAAVDNVTWLTGDGKGLVLGTGIGDMIILQDFAHTVQLPTIVESGVPSSVPVNLYAQAYVDEGTEIQYQSPAVTEMIRVNRPLVEVEVPENLSELDEDLAYYLFEDGTVLADINNLPEGTTVIYKAAPLIEGLKYYKVIENSDPVAYELATAEDLATWGKKPVEEVVEDEQVVVPGFTPVELYLSLGKIEADRAKDYEIQAQGVKYDANHNKIGSGEIASTDIVTVPVASVPSSIEITVSARPEIGQDSPYSFAEGTENVVFLTDGNTGTITARPIIDSFGAFQYTWLKENNEKFEPISDEDVPFVLDTESNTLEVEDEGKYKVSIVNYQNGAAAEAVESDEIIVSALAGAITNANIQYAIGTRSFLNISSTIIYNSSVMSSSYVTLKVSDVTVDGAEGNIEYQWMKQDTEEVNGELVTVWVPIEGATSAEYQIKGGDGIFYPVIKNNLNGSVYTYNGFNNSSITVDDRA